MEWISLKEVAGLEGITTRAVRKRISNSCYVSRQIKGIGGNGGFQYEISLASLSPEAQARYHGKQLEVEEQSESELLSLTESQREVVFEKLNAVHSYQAFKIEYQKADKMVAFLKKYNKEHPENPLNRNKLNHWEKLYNRDGIAGLIDRRGTWNKGVSSIPEDVKKVFLAYWMQEKGTKGGGPSVASCYKFTKMSFPNVDLPSVDTFERLALNVFEPAKVLARYGKKAYQDQFEPYIERNYANIHTNQQWVADNHICDVLVRFPDGHVGRPWVIGFEDMSSRYMVGFHIIEGDPNSDHILDAFITAVGEYGIPETVQTDNGRDYTVRDLFDRNNAYSLANEMCVNVTRAIKYNAKAKNIERAFGTIEYGYLIHLPSYIGANPLKRPEHLKKTNEKLVDVAMPYEEFRICVEWAINEYNNASHSGNSMNGRTPKQAFEENITVPLRIANQELLSIYFQRRSKTVKVGRNGIRIAELNQHYDDIKLFPYAGQKVYARYKTTDVRSVYCFTEDGSFICAASSVQLGELNRELNVQQLRELNSKKKARRKIVRENLPYMSVPSIQELAMSSGMSFNKPDLKLLPSSIAIDSKKQQQLKEIKAEDNRQNKKRVLLENEAPSTALDSDAINRALAERFKIG